MTSEEEEGKVRHTHCGRGPEHLGDTRRCRRIRVALRVGFPLLLFVHRAWRTLTVLGVYFLGLTYYGGAETKWDVHTAVYFISTSVTTVGYGDVVPKSRVQLAISC